MQDFVGYKITRKNCEYNGYTIIGYTFKKEFLNPETFLLYDLTKRKDVLDYIFTMLIDKAIIVKEFDANLRYIALETDEWFSLEKDFAWNYDLVRNKSKQEIETYVLKLRLVTDEYIGNFSNACSYVRDLIEKQYTMSFVYDLVKSFINTLWRENDFLSVRLDKHKDGYTYFNLKNGYEETFKEREKEEKEIIRYLEVKWHGRLLRV